MKKNKSQRKRIVLITAILVVAGLGVWYAIAAKSSPKKTASTTSTTTKTDAASSDDANKNDPTLDKKTTDEATTTPAANQTLAITVSRPVNNDTLPLAEGIEIRSVITGATSGTCSVTATGPGGKTVTKSANITAQPSYGSCSIDIASSQVVAGEWQVAMTVTSGNSTGKANFKVTLQ